MRNITPEMVAEYSSGAVYPALLAELFMETHTLRMWTGIGTLEWNGEQFIGGGNFIGVSAIKESEDLVANGVVVSLNGIPASLISSALAENIRGRPFRMYQAAVTSRSVVNTEDGDNVLTEDGGNILLENQFVTSPYRIFSGLMDYMEFTDSGQTANIRLSVENALIIGQRSKVSRYTPEEQKRTYPSDLGLDLINILQDREVIW